MRGVPVLAAMALLGALLAMPAAAQADDTSPPVIRSVAFDRSTYRPGEEAVARVGVEDESELESVMLTLRDTASPLYLHAFCRVNEEPGIATCRVALPAKAPGGQYVLSGLFARDAIGHETRHQDGDAQRFAPAVAVDSPHADRQPPVLSDFRIERAEAAAGETVQATFRATDASAIVNGGLSLTGPTAATYVTADCAPEGSLLRCPLAIPANQPAGLYTVSYMGAWDEVGYWGIVDHRSGGLPTTGNTLRVSSDVADADGPALLGIDMPDLPVPRGSEYTIRLAASDASDLRVGIVRMRTLHGNAEIDSQCEPDPPGAGPATLTCTETVPRRYPQGYVRLHFLWMSDANQVGSHYFAPWSHGCPTCSWVPDRPEMEQRFLIGPAPLATGLADPLVTAVDPFFPDVKPGHVLPIVVQAVEDVANLTFVFAAVDGTAGQVLSVAGCEPDANRTAIGSLCHLIVPLDAPAGEYVLRRVATLGEGAADVPFDARLAPSFVVSADAESPTFELPDEWAGEVVGGVTSHRFNAAGGSYAMPVLLEVGDTVALPEADGDTDANADAASPDEDATPPADTGLDPSHEGDGLEPAPERPAPGAPAALLLLAVGLAGLARRGGRP